jgi:hypothetical protein
MMPGMKIRAGLTRKVHFRTLRLVKLLPIGFIGSGAPLQMIDNMEEIGTEPALHRFIFVH